MKKIIAFMFAAVLACMLGTTAFAAPFDADALLPVTESFDDERFLSGYDAEITADKTIKIILEADGFAQVGYTVTPDAVIWANFINNEDNLYNSKYMVLQLKNGDQPMAVAPENVAFDSDSNSTPVGISGNAQYPVYLIGKEGNIEAAVTGYSMDRYYIEIPANFDGYVVIPNERLTSDLDEENTTGVGDYMEMHTEQGYRFFWQIVLVVENRGSAEGSIEYVNMFAAADTIDGIIIDDSTPAPEDSTEAPTKQATQTPAATATIAATKAPDADNGLSTGAIIGIAAGAVVIIAAAIIIAVAQKRKKAE